MEFYIAQQPAKKITAKLNINLIPGEYPIISGYCGLKIANNYY
jgi:hypothetical protein